MVVDYCERKQVNRNKPKAKSSFGLYMLFILIVGVAFGLGFGTAWYIYRPARLVAAAAKSGSVPAMPAQGKPVQTAPAPVPAVPAAAPAKGTDIPLTFYETLPKGNKNLIGTGLNPPKDKAAHGAQGEKLAAPAPPAKNPKAAAPQPADVRPAAADSSQGGKDAPATAKGADKKPHEAFVVQVASSKERKEAEEIVANLTGKGVAAYLVESKIEGKGTWYRVRVGKRMSRQDADALAARLGKGSVLIPE